ncbi:MULTISPECIES: DUF4303 domain-containing protein [Erwinia]|nr:DUF4303 domain-containing protein [Erwinia mallotivora]
MKGLWKDNAESISTFICEDASVEDIGSCENQTGFKLPVSYISLMAGHNGGLLRKNVFPQQDRDGNVIKYFICDFLNAIGSKGEFSLLSDWSQWKRPGYKKGVLIGLHMPDNGHGLQFYLDYSLCGAHGEPRVIVHTLSRKNGKPKNVEIELAENFEAFVRGLIQKPKVTPFDFVSFNAELKKRVNDVFMHALKEIKTRYINSFALYTAEDASFIDVAFNTQEYLNNVSSSNKRALEHYSTDDWEYQGEECIKCHCLSELSTQLRKYAMLQVTQSSLNKFRNQLIDNCVAVLMELKQEGFFKKQNSENIFMLVDITGGELPASKMKKIISLLN